MLGAALAHKKAQQKTPKCRRRALGFASSLMRLHSWIHFVTAVSNCPPAVLEILLHLGIPLRLRGGLPLFHL
jgi:hypothetical protein